MTRIEWTDETWNPITGCSKISDGCRFCYAERQASRRLQPYETGLPWTSSNAEKNITLHPARLDVPARWKRPRRIFVCSMSDLFHDQIPIEFIARVWGRMAAEARHTFQVLTKRPARMKEILTDRYFQEAAWFELFARNRFGIVYPLKWPLPNIWGGVSAEDQPNYDKRIVDLLETPLAVRFVSFEPLLGPVDPRLGEPLGRCGYYCDEDIGHIDHRRIDWVIVGGESGPRARPMDPRWVRNIRDQCKAAGIPFFFKQWGTWKPVSYWDGESEFQRVSKAGARELDGVLYEEWPRVSS